MSQILNTVAVIVERARLLRHYALHRASADAQRQRVPIRRLHRSGKWFPLRKLATQEAPPDGARVGPGVALCVLEGPTARHNGRM
jgi:hypothetical protein